jgi:acetyl esterase/lipase
MTELQSDFGLDPEIAVALAAMGARLDGALVQQTGALFSALQDQRLPLNGVRLDDVSYGSDARQTLDICTPGTANAPIVLFVPGGGFVGGDKAEYRHVSAFLARQGFVGVAMNYRLAPSYQWPTGGADVAAALDWLAAHGGEHGADTSRLFVVAHSAGACHASTMLFHPSARPACIGQVRAAVLISGIYQMQVDCPLKGAALYFGEDQALYPDRSSTSHVATNRTPVMVALAEYDPALFVNSALALTDVLTRRDGSSPPFTWLKGHNHLSSVLGLGSKNDEFGPAVAAALRRHA